MTTLCGRTRVRCLKLCGFIAPVKWAGEAEGSHAGRPGRKGRSGPRVALQVLAVWLSGSYFLCFIFAASWFPSLSCYLPVESGFYCLGRWLWVRPRATRGRGCRGWGTCVQAAVAWALPLWSSIWDLEGTLLTCVTPRETLLFLEGAPVYLSRNLLGNLACSVFGRETEILVLSVQALRWYWCGAAPTFLREACPGPSPRLCMPWARAVCGLSVGVIGRGSSGNLPRICLVFLSNELIRSQWVSLAFRTDWGASNFCSQHLGNASHMKKQSEVLGALLGAPSWSL